MSAGTECIEKALNGTELVPEYYLEPGDSMCGDWPPCHGGVSAHSIHLIRHNQPHHQSAEETECELDIQCLDLGS